MHYFVQPIRNHFARATLLCLFSTKPLYVHHHAVAELTKQGTEPTFLGNTVNESLLSGPSNVFTLPSLMEGVKRRLGST